MDTVYILIDGQVRRVDWSLFTVGESGALEDIRTKGSGTVSVKDPGKHVFPILTPFVTGAPIRQKGIVGMDVR